MTAAISLKPRSLAAIALVSAVGAFGFLWPLFVAPGSVLAQHARDAPLLFGLLLPLLLVVLLAEVSEGGIDAKAIAMLGVLSALDAAIRPLGAGTAGIEVMFFLLVLAGRVFGAGFGFVLGATSMFASALLTAGVGPWLPFQMLGAGWVGLGAALLPRCKGWAELALLAAYGAVASLFYGWVLNMWFWPFATGGDTSISFVAGAPLGENLTRFVAFNLATSFGWDLGRAITTVTLILLTGVPVLAALRRAARKANFRPSVSFES
ncbi:energy-coupling factor transport system substrate-specific component [Branchiibius hedensis]|uniref:Energy-coupling factor transport system substrate-specific component n=1 Tax=Branchiibius hedensis TaxID=672460 RepID=A0A2Y9BT88_9MICO|nr:ECF transporter S component [Branchiibius hedensis]PWJ24806.1 energy-coupling factor transport system substrate-specific component [Branchiibius hedensis]SSA33622.1 energy-coupling factor transport system substrate-specific component [Branchiibius hedensis]